MKQLQPFCKLCLREMIEPLHNIDVCLEYLKKDALVAKRAREFVTFAEQYENYIFDNWPEAKRLQDAIRGDV